MTVVRFEPAGFEVEVEAGARMVDVTDDHPEAKVPYSCRAASCGTCRVRVEAGLDALSAPGEEELEVLAIFGDPPDVRLCCQVRLERDAGRVVLRVLDPE
jgi:2Fe-2S ferredoxin